MPVELEVKLRVSDHALLRERLRAVGAVSQGMTHETNTFFDAPDARLRGTDQGLRIRRNRREGREDELVVTYKGPKASGPFKSREEIEITVDDYDALVALFSRLGYDVTLSFDKRRETWTVDETTEVVLDELPKPLGTFAEIEAGSEERIRELLKALQLEGAAQVKESYIEMVANHLQQNKTGQKHLGF